MFLVEVHLTDFICPPFVSETVVLLSASNICLSNFDCRQRRKCCETPLGNYCLLPIRVKSEGREKRLRHLCGEKEEYSLCAPKCFANCEDLDAERRCSECSPGCKCMTGYYRIEKTNSSSTCVPRYVCAKSRAKRICPAKIQLQVNRPYQICESDRDCTTLERCCDSGDLNLRKICVEGVPLNAHTTTSPVMATTTQASMRIKQLCVRKNEEYGECVTKCQPSCRKERDTSALCNGCRPGCQCKDGYLRLTSSSDSLCVSAKTCARVNSVRDRCFDGTVPLGRCDQPYNTCPISFTCEYGLCCQSAEPLACSSKPEVSEVLAAGSCFTDEECEEKEKCCNTYLGPKCLEIKMSLLKNRRS
ncbi:unnamed protein product, partial [Soboliphyme baturini]|uniref:TIL domain-containing protein n=1 Tax=Soboliphyme baturini TaxID=241478 RepID=A0A183IXF0_9BILA